MKDNSSDFDLKYLFWIAAGVVALAMITMSIRDKMITQKELAYELGYKAGIEAGCSDECTNEYSDGYEDGYLDGYTDGTAYGKSSSNYGYSDYNDSYSSGDIDEMVSILIEAADSYAYKYTEVGLYDAWDIVSIYLDGEDPDGNPLPTYREFVDAVDTLMLFSMFFQLNYGEFDSIIHQYDPFFG